MRARRERDFPRTGCVLAALLLAASSSSCIPAPSVTSGPDLPRESVERLRPGATTRKALLDSLGIPSAVFGRGRPERLPVVPAWPPAGLSSGVLAAFGSVPADPAAAFAPFDDRGTAGPDDRVWLYRHTSSGKMSFFLLLVIIEQGWTHTDRLWVLVDERKGVVKDLVAYP